MADRAETAERIAVPGEPARVGGRRDGLSRQPSGQGLGQLQALADGSPTVHGHAALQRVADARAGVVQRKDLAPKKLNVAGEDHPESKARRAHEAQYAADKVGGIYRTEGEFKVAKSVIDTERFGDPLMLRAEMLLAIMREKWIDRILVPIADGTPSNLGWDAVKDRLAEDVGEIALALAMASRDAAETDAAQKSSGVHMALKTLQAQIATKSTGDVRTFVIPGIQKVIASYAADVLGLGDIRAEAEINVLRSEAMKAAAEDNGARWVGEQTGLWKIGDSHVTDIQGSKTSGKFEILTRAEFNDGFEAWKRGKGRATPF